MQWGVQPGVDLSVKGAVCFGGGAGAMDLKTIGLAEDQQ